MKKLTAECDYTMPVLSEHEKAYEIEMCESEIERLEITLKSGGSDTPHHVKSALVRQKIALATLTAMPMGRVDCGEYDDSGSHPDAKVVCLHDQADWENFADGTLLWLAPSVPVKQEGEQ